MGGRLSEPKDVARGTIFITRRDAQTKMPDRSGIFRQACLEVNREQERVRSMVRAVLG